MKLSELREDKSNLHSIIEKRQNESKVRMTMWLKFLGASCTFYAIFLVLFLFLDFSGARNGTGCVVNDAGQSGRWMNTFKSWSIMCNECETEL